MGIIRFYKVTDRPLTSMRGTKIPSYFLFFDTETRAKKDGIIESHQFRLGWTCFWDRKTADESKRYEWRFWEDAKDICEYMHVKANACGTMTIIAHNIYFDLQVCGFFDYFTAKGWELKFIYDNGPTFILKCKLSDKIILALSTTNWFDQSLRSLGEVIGLKKKDVNPLKASRNRLIMYCRRDVEILVKVLEYYIDFIRKCNLGQFSYSKASQAFTAFRHRFMQTKIRIHKDENVVQLERAAYMGGRCECFYVGQAAGGPFVTLDVNSMYPYVMTKFTYPTQLVDYVLNPSFEKINRCLNRYAVIAEVSLSTGEPAFAYMLNKKTVFPVGEFDAFLCTEGLKYALDRNMIKSFKRAAIYIRDDIFSSYMQYFHTLRYGYKAENNDIMVTLCKYLENALYGKFGQKFSLEDIEEKDGTAGYFRESILDMRNKRWLTVTHLMNKVITKYGETEGRNAMVAIAAHVTENARMLLWEIIKSIGRERVLYCDTDCVKIRFSDMPFVTYPIKQGQLGALKQESITNQLFIGGAKYYVDDHNRHIKGIPRDAVEVEPGVFGFYTWPKMTYHLREGIITGYHRKKIYRRISINYDKGVVMPDGRVIPFTLPFSL